MLSVTQITMVRHNTNSNNSTYAARLSLFSFNELVFRFKFFGRGAVG